MNKWIIVGACALALAMPARAAEPGNDFCLRCHGRATLAFRDGEHNGRLVNLHIDQASLARSEHRGIPCVQCHGDNFASHPNHDQVEGKPLTCQGCHAGQDTFKKYRLEAISRQFEKSIHFQNDPNGFDCFSCHDPHAPGLSGRVSDMGARVQHNNAMCQTCHEPKSHDWLPDTARHLESVRCVDCHVPGVGGDTHAIPAAKRAEKRCESCHSKDSHLLAKLYRFQAMEERRRAGFINSVVMNDAYVVGMTRNAFLDGLTVILAGLTAAGLAAHALGRMVSAFRRRRRNQGKEAPSPPAMNEKGHVHDDRKGPDHG